MYCTKPKDMKVYVLIQNVDNGYHIEKMSFDRERIESECRSLNEKETERLLISYSRYHEGYSREELIKKIKSDCMGDRYEIVEFEIE